MARRLQMSSAISRVLASHSKCENGVRRGGGACERCGWQACMQHCVRIMVRACVCNRRSSPIVSSATRNDNKTFGQAFFSGPPASPSSTAMGYDVGRHMAHAWSTGYSERLGDRVRPMERRHRQQEAVHGGGVHGSGVWTTEAALNDWHLQHSIKYAGPFHPEYAATPVPISVAHCGLHDATIDFKTAVRGIVPGYTGHVPRARDMYGSPASGGITPERGWKRNERTGQMLEETNFGPMGDRAYADGPIGTSSRPHAFSRKHNRVSDECKPGFGGHVPNARDTFGSSHYRDAFSHRTGASRHHEVEDGALSARSTSGLRFFSQNRQELSRSAASLTPRSPGLADRERISGRPNSARRHYPGGRYFTLSDKRDLTPRGTPRGRRVTV